ncbi:ATP-binding cassette domain-containing protein [Ramlibacter sp. AN1015]|uniref:ABC transporter ATP-binding protein n=1 Tax=Ramlibacter sp. AN1015 TaxID=3133428 RepID=UPI0030C618F4
MQAPVLQLDRVSAGYGPIPILHRIALQVGSNESVALIGANGAGKSTLVRAISGLLPVSEGQVLLSGQDISRLAPHERVARGLGVVLENRHLFGELTLRAHLELAQVHGSRRAVQQPFTIEDVLALFPFMRARLQSPVELFSGGEQQMVAIARALLLQPLLLIMDEPSTGLAPKVLGHIVDAVQLLRERGVSILLVEQNVALAARIADRGYAISVGRVAAEIAAEKWRGIIDDEALLRVYLGG